MQDKDKNSPLRKEDLERLTSSPLRYQHPVYKHFFYTQGVQHVAQNGMAYELIDAIIVISNYLKEDIMKGEFVVWKLIKRRSDWLLYSEDNNGNLINEQVIKDLSFPLDEIKFYLIGNVLMLSSEYDGKKDKEQAIFYFFHIEEQNRGYEYTIGGVVTIPKGKDAAVFINDNIVSDWYDDLTSEKDSTYYFKDGEVSARLGELREISKAHYEVLKQYIDSHEIVKLN